MTANPTIVLHSGSRLSGHSHRAELMLRLLDLPYELHTLDLAKGEHKTAAFRALSPFGTVPALVEGDLVLADSVAILVYLASRYDPERRWLPTDPVAAAKVQRWLSVAQGPVFNGPCAARLMKLFGRNGDPERAAAIARELLGVLEDELRSRVFLVGEAATIADVALYSYVARAPDGGISLDAYPAVRAWLARIEALPGFLAMPAPQAVS